jgi:hypothetical protein
MQMQMQMQTQVQVQVQMQMQMDDACHRGTLVPSWGAAWGLRGMAVVVLGVGGVVCVC